MNSDCFKRNFRGRGAADNPANRFERIYCEPLPEEAEGREVSPATEFYRDTSRTILSRNDSPDVGFDVSLNPYRGCEHGCIYCYARPTHEYLGFSAGLDFETRILIKEDAAALLRRELSSPRWKPQPIALCGVTDPYQPLEKGLRLTRACLEVLAEFRNPVLVVTKNYLVTRDLDLLLGLVEHRAVQVSISITTLDPKLQRLMEPRASTPERRLAAIGELARLGIPVRVLVAPVIPGLTDSEMPSIVAEAVQCGAGGVGYQMLRLPHGVKGLFEAWLKTYYPDRKARVLNRIQEVRAGKLNDPRFHSRMKGEGQYAEQIKLLFEAACRRAGLDRGVTPLSTDAFRASSGQGQLPLS